MGVILKAEEGLHSLGLQGYLDRLRQEREELGLKHALNTLLLKAFEARLEGRSGALSPAPEVSAGDCLALRSLMDEAGVPVWEREEYLSLHRYLFLLDHVEAAEYRNGECIYLASRVFSASVLAVLESHGEKERRDLLELAFDEAQVTPRSMTCLLESDALDPDHAEAKRAANTLRWFRIHDGLTDKWAAWTRLPALLRPQKATLTIQVSLPGGPPPPPSLLQGKKIIDMDSVKAPKGAQARRRTAVQSIAQRLRSGTNVAYLANNTTQESRRAAIQAAREAGAGVEFLFYGGSIQTLYLNLERESWPVPERAFTRAASVFEAPRPHEGEVVYVYDEQGLMQTWTMEVDGSITREVAEAKAASPAEEGCSEPAKDE